MPPKKQSSSKAISSYSFRKAPAVKNKAAQKTRNNGPPTLPALPALPITPAPPTLPALPAPPALKRSRPNSRILEDQPSVRPQRPKPSRHPVPQNSNRRIAFTAIRNPIGRGTRKEAEAGDENEDEDRGEDENEHKNENEHEDEDEDEDEDEEIVDFAVELSYKIYINKSIRRRKNLPNTTRDRLLDLSKLDQVIGREVNLLGKTEHYSALNIIQRTAFVGIAGKKSVYKPHDLDDFSLKQAQVLERLLNSTKE
ncbi:MAG: hypothetical protein M1840_006100 [Geoglossum simile]|nr:MAG: hypothetical protein M1840_006100 [Geoglossum simile]